MNKKISYFIISSLFFALPAKGINWNEVNSHVAWLNVYESRGFLNLSAGGKPALNGNGPASLFSKTKFPSGTHQVAIFDTRAKKNILSDTIRVQETGNHLIITHGPQGKPSMEFFHQTDFLPQGGGRIIFFVNALGEGNATVSYEDKEGSKKIDRVNPSLKLRVNKLEDIENLQIQLEAKNGSRRLEKITLPPMEEFNGLIIVAYLDSDNFSAIRYAVIDAQTLEFVSLDAPLDS